MSSFRSSSEWCHYNVTIGGEQCFWFEAGRPSGKSDNKAGSGQLQSPVRTEFDQTINVVEKYAVNKFGSVLWNFQQWFVCELCLAIW